MKSTSAAVLTLSVIVAACGSKTDANEKNFNTAMSQYFEKKGAQCLRGEKWPVDFSVIEMKMHERNPQLRVNQMEALVTAGLAKGEDVQVDAVDFIGKPNGRKAQVRRYVLTEAARPFEQEVVGGLSRGYTELCWGQLAVDKIVKWEGPMKFGDYQEAGIVYTYKVVKVADWASKPEVLAAYAQVKQVFDGVEKTERKHMLKLTSIGWEAKGLDNTF